MSRRDRARIDRPAGARDRVPPRVWWIAAVAIAFAGGILGSTWLVRRTPDAPELPSHGVRPLPALPAADSDAAAAAPPVVPPKAATAPPPAAPGEARGRNDTPAMREAPPRPAATATSSPSTVASPALPPPSIALPVIPPDGGAMPGALPTSPVPAAPRASDAAPSAVAEDVAVRRTLDDYAGAYAALDVDATAQAWPTVDRQALSKAFATLKSQSVTFDSCAVDVTPPQAVARCRGSVRFVRKVGSPGPRVASQQWTFRMHRVGGGWKIDDVVAGPAGSQAP